MPNIHGDTFADNVAKANNLGDFNKGINHYGVTEEIRVIPINDNMPIYTDA